MTLAAGTRLGAYEITGTLGAGGMGEVYRATDTKLGREVAIKTLPAALADDRDRLARFEREAKLLATLNHQHIASVYGLDEHAGTIYLAMELVAGETLEEKLKAGRLPVDDALRIALQVAEALEAAHEKGVVHRDLKPANIMVTGNGIAKVLDFGLAKAFSSEAQAAGLGHSPALSLAMTQAGLVLGTAGYMSPEQASGQPTDQRADIWGFGVVLYEMLTGLPLFRGESVPHVLAEVLKTEPDWSRLPPNLHPRLKLLLERCLEKRVRNRYHSIADVRVDIEKVLGDPAGTAPPPAAVGVGSTPPRRWLPALAIAIASTAAVAALVAWRFWPTPPAPAVTRFLVRSNLATVNPRPTISADGRRIAVTGGNPTAIYVRDLAEFDFRRVEDTADNAPVGLPCFSPDGEWLAFGIGNGALRRAPVMGGRGLTVVRAPELGRDRERSGGAVNTCDWAEDGHVYFSDGAEVDRVPEAGGAVERLYAPEGPGSSFISYPQLLPGGKKLLVAEAPTDYADLTVRVVVVDIDSGERTVLLEDAGQGWFVRSPTQPRTGYVIYGQDNALFAVPLDPETLSVGAPSPVLDSVLVIGTSGLAAISDTGTIVYTSTIADAVSGNTTVASVDRQGVATTLLGEPRNWGEIALSPDGERNVMGTLDIDTLTADMWMHSLAGGPLTRVTFGGVNGSVVWTPDGTRLIYVSYPNIGGVGGSLASMPADGSAPPVTLRPPAREALFPTSISPDGRTLLVTVRTNNVQSGTGDVGVLTLEDGPEAPIEGDIRFVLASDFNEGHAGFSPDGRWIAFESDESGQQEIYVVPFPGPGAKSQVSVGGGRQPRWNPAGGELFYLRDTSLMVAEVATEGAAFRVIAAPRALFEDSAILSSSPNGDAFQYAVRPDGQSFVMLRGFSPTETGLEFRVVENWLAEVEGTLRGDRR